MRVRVFFFAGYRQITGQREMTIELPESTTAGKLLDQLVEKFPALQAVASASRSVVNKEYVPSSTRLSNGDEVAFLPPVSGGDRFELSERPIDPRVDTADPSDDKVGAMVIFAGQARRLSKGRRVLYLEYEAYQAMAEKKLAEIGAEIRRRWPVEEVVIRHRLGRIEIGELSVVIVVRAAHRDAAFEGCRYAIEQIKQVAPVWKKEVWEDGEVWVGMEGA